MQKRSPQEVAPNERADLTYPERLEAHIDPITKKKAATDDLYYSPFGSQRALELSSAASTGWRQSSVDAILGRESKSEQVLRSLEDDETGKDSHALVRPESRHGLDFNSLVQATTTTEAAEVLGELRNSQLPPESPASAKRAKVRSSKTSTPTAGEKRKRSTAGGSRPRKTPSKSSTPSSVKKKNKGLEGNENVPPGF